MEFQQAVELLSIRRGKSCSRALEKVHIAAKIAATMNSTGTRSMFLHAGEALHGDLGAVESEDVVMCCPKAATAMKFLLLPALKKRGCPLVALTSTPDSPLGRTANVLLHLDASEEACGFDLAPTTSTSLQLAMGDALAMALMDRSGFQPDDFAKNHPAGVLGKRLTWTLAELVDERRRPAVSWDADISAILQAMSEGRYGATIVWHATEANQVEGIVTDGDLRRALADGDVAHKRAGDLASLPPKSLPAETLASHAASWMQKQGISQVVVMRGESYVGMVHLHDCLREGLV